MKICSMKAVGDPVPPGTPAFVVENAGGASPMLMVGISESGMMRVGAL